MFSRLGYVFFELFALLYIQQNIKQSRQNICQNCRFAAICAPDFRNPNHQAQQDGESVQNVTPPLLKSEGQPTFQVTNNYPVMGDH